MNNDIKLFDITDLAIAELKDRYMDLKIIDYNDKEGFAIVREARLDMKRYRVDIEKRRKELNEDALKHQRRINTEAKKITDQLLPIEDHLFTQEEEFQEANVRIKRELEEAIKAKRQDRIDKMLSIGFTFNGQRFACKYSTESHSNDSLQSIDDDTFDKFFALSVKEYEAEQERTRLAREEIDRKTAEDIAAQEVKFKEFQKFVAEQAAKEAAEQAIERKRLDEQAKILAQKEAELKAEADRIAAVKAAAEKEEAERLAAWKNPNENKPIIIKPVEYENDNPELKSYRIEIGGTFNFAFYCTSKNFDLAKEKAIEKLYDIAEDSRVDFDIEQVKEGK